MKRNCLHAGFLSGGRCGLTHLEQQGTDMKAAS